MSLDVKHINGDATFLLTFSAPLHSSPYPTTDGTFTVLIDPWLAGESTIWHPKFALAKRTLPPCIHHLSEISPPNVVIVSQDRTDHCHEATLRQLDAQLPDTVILAAPAAAKRIKSWKYFEPSKVHAFPQFSDKKGNSIIRFRIPSTVSGAMPGEATLAFIGAKFDIAGVHNAIGITYRPPASAPLIASPLPSPAFTNLRYRASALELSYDKADYQAFPPTPPESPPTSANNSLRSTSRSRQGSFPESSFLLPPMSPQDPRTMQRPPATPSSLQFDRINSSQNTTRASLSKRTSFETNDLGSPPLSPALTNVSTNNATHTPFRPKALSVIYSPHGLSYQELRPYVTSHLIQNAALPLTLLLHSFDRISNPWYLGGNVNAGSPGGLEIARNLLAKCWISAHDEDKENSGLAVLKAVTRKYTAEEVAALLEEGNNGRAGKDKSKERRAIRVKTKVRVLDVGETMQLP